MDSFLRNGNDSGDNNDINNYGVDSGAPTQVIPAVGVTAASATATDIPFAQIAVKSSPNGPRKSYKGRIITLSVVGAIIVLLIAAFFVANWYFSTRVSPGVQFRGTSLTGQTREQVQKVVSDTVKSTGFTISDSDGKSADATYDDLGVSIDVDKTVDAIMAAKSENMFTRINPFSSSSVTLSGTIDNMKLQKYLVSSLVPDDNQAVPASVAFDSKTQKYVATDGKIGKSPQISAVTDAIKTSFAAVLSPAEVSVDLTDVEQPISLATAQAASKEANSRLANPIVLSDGQAGDGQKSYTVPVADIAKWTVITPDPDKGTISVTYDKDAIKSSLPNALTSALTQAKVDEQKVVLPGGGSIIKTAGVPQVTVSSSDAQEAVSKVIDALDSNQKADITVKSTTTNFASSTVADYNRPNGEHWVKVDLSAQKAYAYAGSTLMKSFNVATGSLAHATPAGTYFVRAQLTIQTMVGDDYVTPDVRWISYFNGGVALHAGYWDEGPGQQIDIGQPTSHGCVNMRTPDAEWIYHFINVGSLVQVVGNTPSAPVRAPGAQPQPTANSSQS